MHPIRWLIAALALAYATTSFAVLEISIQGGQTEPVPIAVVPFEVSDADAVGIDIAAVVAADLERSGLFRAFPRDDMISRPSQLEDVNYGDWRALGVEHLIIGSVQPDGSGNWQVEFRLLDVYRQQQSIWQRIPTRRDALRHAAHSVADQIYERMTGHKGVFGTQIAYVTADGPLDQRKYRLIVADADGHAPQELAYSSEPIMSPAWSLDGQQLAFVAFRNGRPVIYRKTLAGQRALPLSSEPGINGAPAWSPDGRRLAVTLSKDGNPEIYILDALSGNRLKRVTTNNAIDTEPAWSPDGQSLIFTSDRGGRAQIYRVPVAGGDAERLTFDGRSNSRASFAPDGKSIVMVHSDQRGDRIAVMDLESRQVNVLSDGPLDESPSFAPNGVVIIYSTRGERGTELATVTVDTGIRQQLRQTGEVREPAWSPFSK